MASIEEIEQEIKRREGVVSTQPSILEQPKESSVLKEVGKFAESATKGGLSGIIDLLGGWGSVYDKIKNEGLEPSALSSQGIKEWIAKKTGIDLQKIEGYKGAYTAGQAAGPAVALSAAGLPGLFSRSLPGLAAEGVVAGGTSIVAQSAFPDSPLAQFVLQSSPYAIKGGFEMGQNRMARPVGSVGTSAEEALKVGPLTPGEATGSRVQLARESAVEANPVIEQKANVFRQKQAESVDSFLSSLLSRTRQASLSPEQATISVTKAFDNYGKALSTKLNSDARTMFNAAKTAGGKVDTSPILAAVEKHLSGIPPETPGFEGLKSAMSKIKEQYVVEGKPATTVAGVDASGAPILTEQPAVPSSAAKIDIGRLQKNLSAWSEAAYKGTADFGAGNIFEGVAPGQVKGVARSILRGYRDALDKAIADGVPGANELKKARDTFSRNIDQINTFADRPLVKAFDVEAPTDLTPEKVVERIKKAPPSERILLEEILRGSPNGEKVWNTVRVSTFDDLVSKASLTSETGPSLDLGMMMQEIGKKKGDFDFLFPNPQEKAKALTLLSYLKKVNQSAVGDTQLIKGSDVGAVVAGAGGSRAAANASREGFTVMVKELLLNPNKLAAVMFNPDTVNTMLKAQKAGTMDKFLEAANVVAKTTANVAARTGPRIAPVTPVDTSQQEEYTGPSVEEIQRVLEERTNSGAP